MQNYNHSRNRPNIFATFFEKFFSDFSNCLIITKFGKKKISAHFDLSDNESQNGPKNAVLGTCGGSGVNLYLDALFAESICDAFQLLFGYFLQVLGRRFPVNAVEHHLARLNLAISI